MKNKTHKQLGILFIMLLGICLETKAQPSLAPTLLVDETGVDIRKPNGPSVLYIDTVKSMVGVNTALPTQALEVAGRVLIRDANETLINIKHDHPYNLWVTKGVVAEDLFIVNKDNWADYVFEKDYDLMSIEELEKFIKENKHLPNIPAAKEVKDEGYSQHDINAKLLSKIEELTLYTLQQEKELKKQLEIVNQQNKQIDDLVQILEIRNFKTTKRQ